LPQAQIAKYWLTTRWPDGPSIRPEICLSGQKHGTKNDIYIYS